MSSEAEKHSARVKIINERLVETSLTCTCGYQPWACQACDFEKSNTELTEREAVIRKRFKSSALGGGDSDSKDCDDSLKTSDYDPHNGWLERDPETTQTFKRSQQVGESGNWKLTVIELLFRRRVFSLFPGAPRTPRLPTSSAGRRPGSSTFRSCRTRPTTCSTPLTGPTSAAARTALWVAGEFSQSHNDICHFQFEYELACNEVLGWKKRSTTVEGFTKEVNTFCDPSAFSVMHNIVQDKYRALPCTIMWLYQWLSEQNIGPDVLRHLNTE